MIETITLTRKSYDELNKSLNETKELLAKETARKMRVEDVAENLKQYIFDKFMENHKYSTNSIATAKDYLSFYFGDNGFKEYDELCKVLGYEFIERKVVELYDNVSKEPKD